MQQKMNTAENSAWTGWRYLWKERQGGERDEPRTRESICSVNSRIEEKNRHARSGSACGCFPWRGRAGPHGRPACLRLQLWTTCTRRYVQVGEERAARPGQPSPWPAGSPAAVTSGRLLSFSERRAALWHSEINPLNQPARRRFWD